MWAGEASHATWLLVRPPFVKVYFTVLIIYLLFGDRVVQRGQRRQIPLELPDVGTVDGI